MARGTMHAPKAGAKHGRSKGVHVDVTRLVRDGVLRGPDLVEATGKADWLPQVLSWYETWRRSPQAQVFEETDWVRLAMIAPFVESCWVRPSAAAMAEIRMTEERLGATVVDRMRARMRIEDPEDEEPESGTEGVTPITSARSALAARLADDEDDE